MTDPENEEHVFGLIMPFVVVKSAGGALDDLSFTCGWDCGELYGELETCHRLGATPRARFVKPEIMPQLDLIAMKHGFTMTMGDPDPYAGWPHVTFMPVDPHAAVADE